MERLNKANLASASSLITTQVKLSTYLADHHYDLNANGAGTGSIRCPFHDDNNPSLFYDDGQGVWHCFGCNRGGSVIKFAMEEQETAGEPQSMLKAVYALAKQYKITLPDLYESPVIKAPNSKARHPDRHYDFNRLKKNESLIYQTKLTNLKRTVHTYSVLTQLKIYATINKTYFNGLPYRDAYLQCQALIDAENHTPATVEPTVKASPNQQGSEQPENRQ